MLQEGVLFGRVGPDWSGFYELCGTAAAFPRVPGGTEPGDRQAGPDSSCAQCLAMAVRRWGDRVCVSPMLGRAVHRALLVTGAGRAGFLRARGLGRAVPYLVCPVFCILMPRWQVLGARHRTQVWSGKSALSGNNPA